MKYNEQGECLYQELSKRGWMGAFRSVGNVTTFQDTTGKTIAKVVYDNQKLTREVFFQWRN
jgi:hypothetical protein